MATKTIREQEIAEMRRANDLREQEVRALFKAAAIAEAKANEGSAWDKFWHGGDGGAGARSRHMRVSY